MNWWISVFVATVARSYRRQTVEESGTALRCRDVRVVIMLRMMVLQDITFLEPEVLPAVEKA